MAKLMNIATTKARIIEATNAIVVGNTYFLSAFYESDGATVKVLSKSTKTNKCGWPSSVTVEVIERIGDSYKHHETFYAPGTIHSVNATNLYSRRSDASAAAKYADDNPARQWPEHATRKKDNHHGNEQKGLHRISRRNPQPQQFRCSRHESLHDRTP